MGFGKKKNTDKDNLSADASDLAAGLTDVDLSTLDDHGSDSEADGSDRTKPVEQTASDEEISNLKAECQDFRNKYLLALADFENYKKRAIKERAELLKYQGEQVFVDMLAIVDNLDLALQHAEADPAQLKSGVEMIHKMFLEVLAKWDVRGESGLGSPFDPVRHHALSRLEVDTAAPGVILNELKKAYFYKDKLLRPAEVVVAAPKSEAPPVDEELN